MFVTARFTDLRRARLLGICKLHWPFTMFARICLRFNCRIYTDHTAYRAVFISFGGLLLYLEGPYKKLAPLRIDYVYLLLKK